MTTLVRASRPEVFRDYLSERDLAERWGVSLRTVQRRVSAARSLAPVGVQDRLPHFHRRDVEACEANRSIAPRMGRSRPLKSPIFSVCVAHRKGGQSKTSSCFYLARELSAAGKRVVLRDLDAQRSLTKILRALGAPEDEFGRLTFLRRVALVPDVAPGDLAILYWQGPRRYRVRRVSADTLVRLTRRARTEKTTLRPAAVALTARATQPASEGKM